MKTKEENLGSAKRFGARYGRKPKAKFSNIETEQRKFHKCPYCSKTAVKRESMGIWSCRKCKAKFTGKAYSITKSFTAKEAEKAFEPEPEDAEIAAEEAEEAEESLQEA